MLWTSHLRALEERIPLIMTVGKCTTACQDIAIDSAGPSQMAENNVGLDRPFCLATIPFLVFAPTHCDHCPGLGSLVRA